MVEIRVVGFQITPGDEDDVSLIKGSADQDLSSPVADVHVEVLSLEGLSCALEHCVDFETFPVY